MSWEAALDPRLTARLTRSLHRPGLLTFAVARRIQRRIDALYSRLSLLARFVPKLRELSIADTAIAHPRAVAREVRVVTAAAPVPAPALPIVHPAPSARHAATLAMPTRIVERVETRTVATTSTTFDRTLVVERSPLAPSEVKDVAPHTTMLVHRVDSNPEAPPPRRSRMGASIITRKATVEGGVELVTPRAPAIGATDPQRLAHPAPASAPLVALAGGITALVAAGIARTGVRGARVVRAHPAARPTPAAALRDAVVTNATTAAAAHAPAPMIVHASRPPDSMRHAATIVARSAPLVAPRPQVRSASAALVHPDPVRPLRTAMASAIAATPTVPRVAASEPQPAIRLAPPVATQHQPKVDLHELADHVQRIIARRDVQARERKGWPR